MNERSPLVNVRKTARTINTMSRGESHLSRISFPLSRLSSLTTSENYIKAIFHLRAFSFASEWSDPGRLWLVTVRKSHRKNGCDVMDIQWTKLQIPNLRQDLEEVLVSEWIIYGQFNSSLPPFGRLRVALNLLSCTFEYNFTIVPTKSSRFPSHLPTQRFILTDNAPT